MTIPKHVAIIMDGNRRWARAHGLEVFAGHQKMVNEGIQNLVRSAKKLGIEQLTLWAMSTENWNRDSKEVDFLMSLFRKMFQVEGKKLQKENVKIAVIGDVSRFDSDIQEGIKKWMAETSKNTGMTVTFALNYGGRDEILRAAQAIARQAAAGKLDPSGLTEQSFAEHLDTAGMPDPDLIIRTGGDQRLSGFLPWQSNYAELYFTPVLMPDFGQKELEEALQEFARRERRFGK